jgi:hypothetical protein
LFGKRPKLNPKKTDKELGSLQSAGSGVVQASPRTGAQPWRVEMIIGPQSEEIWFDGDTKDARRLNGELGWTVNDELDRGGPERMEGTAGATPR